MEHKGLSIITNYGCHWKCPYCITKETHSNLPITEILDPDILKVYDIFQKDPEAYTSISISGGGDPLWNIDNDRISDFIIIGKLARMNNVPFSLHTSLYNHIFKHAYFAFDKIVFHVNTINDLALVEKCVRFTFDPKFKPIIRVVFVVKPGTNLNELVSIWDIVDKSWEIDELSFRQFVNPDWSVDHTLEETLRQWQDAGRSHYIEQRDYNDYIFDGQLFHAYSDLLKAF